ncbi:hypothetical protein [Klebsiella michiganensis]|uniref:hypothetical protein n=1 Tax=Klebsiella michiganensis TaxID=1134687 RepID=UPI001CCC2875|nr:hypothetical protein [Klebsiella michiganensis]
MTNNQLTDERLVKILSETQATIMEHNSRCVRGSVEVDARLFESMLMELQERRNSEMDSDPVAYTDERNLGYIDRGRETAYLWGKQNTEVGDIALYRHAQQPVDNTFIPKNLDKALGVVGVALPESKEEFNFQIERWIQRLIDRVIRYSDEFKEQPAAAVPGRSIFEKWWESQNGAPLDGWDSLRTADGYCDDGIDGQFEAWNAAMLAAAPQEVPDGK